ncbi:8686_t:CDS:2 [Acaulospora morrowiae]|uniref:8686_t:CDS:1 n=1 Tax=Acaulospora morrowiae TaxID=94023 RepID=A0A9N9HFR7_9GLOM|nr:8686_t:CDS:2 [Acaulospora morrowiae]
MDTLPKVRVLYNDSVTNDLTFRIDGRIYFAHKCILSLQSEWFRKYFDSHGGFQGEDKHLYLDLSCSKKFVIEKWHDVESMLLKNDFKEHQVRNEVTNEKIRVKNVNLERRQEDYDESTFRFEIYYNYEIFGYFLSYCYGWSIQPKTTDELFAVAYLAKKFQVPSLTKFVDCLLRHVPKSWKPNEHKWKAGLMVSKWLVLVETRLSILNFLARTLTVTKGAEKRAMVKSIIRDEDYNEVERLMAEIYEENIRSENEFFEDDVLGLDKNGNLIGVTGNITSEQSSSDESSENSSSTYQSSLFSSSEDSGSES